MKTLANHLGELFPLTDTGRELFFTLIRRLALGAPVSPTELSKALRWPFHKLYSAIGELSCSEFDSDHNIVGAAGLCLCDTQHVIEIDKRRLYARCPLDAILIPILLGKTARISSECANTLREIRLTVAPNELRDIDPGQTVVSLVPEALPRDMREVRFFVSGARAATWLLKFPTGIIIPVKKIHALGLRIRDDLSLTPSLLSPLRRKAVK